MKRVPLLDLARQYRFMESDIRAAVEACLKHQQWILGPEVAELEKRIARYLGTGNCIGVSSGTDALVLSLRAISLKLKKREYFDRKDKILTTAFTFTATGDAILRSGATPVFVDIDPRTYNLSPGRIREYMSRNGERVVGIVPVHLYGMCCDMDEMTNLARDYGLFVVEDAAQAFGATWRGKKAGTMGDAGAFSFFPSKNLGCFGDGGMVSTNDGEIAALVRMLGKHGGRDKYNVEHIGYNARLDTIQAAVLLARLGYVDELNLRRRRVAEAYTTALRGVEGVVPPAEDQGHVYNQYTVRITGGNRDRMKEHLSARGIDSMIYYQVPLHRMSTFQHRCGIAGGLEETAAACGQVLSLPIEPLLTEEEIDATIYGVKSFCAEAGTTPVEAQAAS